MPSATTSKPVSAGTKRKSVPLHTKESKKPKIEEKAASKSKSAKKALPKEDISSDDSEDESGSEGGVQLDESEEESNVKAPNNEEDGLHPERAKAVIANSM